MFVLKCILLCWLLVVLSVNLSSTRLSARVLPSTAITFLRQDGSSMRMEKITATLKEKQEGENSSRDAGCSLKNHQRIRKPSNGKNKILSRTKVLLMQYDLEKKKKATKS